MAVVHVEPVRELMSIQDRMNRMFDEAFRAGNESKGSWAPAVDIYEADGAIAIKADLPGIDPEKVDIKLENTVLTIRGERGEDENVPRESYHRSERAYGPFSRSFDLPSNVDQDRITADYRDGILLVRLPKLDSQKPRRIQIKAEGP